VLNHVNVDPGPNGLVKTFRLNSIDNFLNGEVGHFGSLAM
jgi:hypothetical protein